MTRRVLLALLLVSLASCKKTESSAPLTPPATAEQTEAPAEPAGPIRSTTAGGAPKSVPTQAVVIPAEANLDATLGQLSVELRAYVSATRSKPKDFADFAMLDHLHAPPPPDGKQYAIAGGKVILVSR